MGLSQNTTAYPPTLNALTGARFVAALLVVFNHFIRIEGGPNWLNTLFSNGGHGVEFFFILSGFILSYSYLTRFNLRHNFFREFWIARCARIVPVYWFALIISIPLLFLQLKQNFGTQLILWIKPLAVISSQTEPSPIARV